MTFQTLSIWIGPEIIYLYGTVNGEDTIFTKVSMTHWQATVPKSEDDVYSLHLEAYSANGLEGTYEFELYYGMLPLITDRSDIDIRYRTRKAFYNAEDLNRVGNVVMYLVNQLNLYGYAIDTNIRTNWTEDEIPTLVEMDHYLNTIKQLKATLYGTVPLPNTMSKLTFESANNIEKALLEVERYLNRMLDGFKYCGTFKCGQGVIL